MDICKTKRQHRQIEQAGNQKDHKPRRTAPARTNSHRLPNAAGDAAGRGKEPERHYFHTSRRHPHENAGTGHPNPTPIYTPDARIRGSPTFPPPERTEEGRGTHGGAGKKREGKGNASLFAFLCTVEEEKGEGEDLHRRLNAINSIVFD